jgi:hypothetical protein
MLQHTALAHNSRHQQTLADASKEQETTAHTIKLGVLFIFCKIHVKETVLRGFYVGRPLSLLGGHILRFRMAT